MKQIKVGFVGSQGSGKTTKAYELATSLKKQRLDVYVLSEVARSCPFPINEDTDIQSQLWILGKTITREQSSKGHVLIHDRTLLDALAYSMYVNREFFEPLKAFIKNYMSTYDYIVYCRPNDSYLIDDGLRSISKKFRDEIDDIMTSLLDELDIDTIDYEDVETCITFDLTD